MSNPRWTRLQRLTLGVGTLCTVFAAHPTAAQVGHAPGASPYRDLYGKYLVSFVGGYSLGSGGKVTVGPAHGPLGSVRFDMRVGGPGSLQVGVAAAKLDRLIIDPTQGPDDRVVATARQTVALFDVGFNMLLAGEKTWNRLAPYFGLALGLAVGGQVPQDTVSGFKFSTKFTLTPQLGVRVYAARRFALRIEARDVIWRLSYPRSFFLEPANAPGEAPVLDERINKSSQWTHNPMFLVSVGWAFGR